jgi:hypothetical protein
MSPSLTSRTTFLALALLLGLPVVTSAQTQTVAYDLVDVWLAPDSGAPGQMTGRFEWTYSPGDFENGTGQFLALDVPFTSFAMESLDFSFDLDAIEITLNGNWHDFGVDVMLRVDPGLSPDQPVPVDVVNSSFGIENYGIVKKGSMISGSVVPDLPANPWVELGGAMAGTEGLPTHVGTGTMTANDPVGLVLGNALANTTAGLVIGLTELDAPFKGGVLVPDPLIILTGFSTGPAGSITLDTTWPDGIPSGFTSYYQWWISDPDGPKGFAASPALQGTAP